MPDETLASFQRAMDDGADYIEMDAVSALSAQELHTKHCRHLTAAPPAPSGPQQAGAVCKLASSLFMPCSQSVQYPLVFTGLQQAGVHASPTEQDVLRLKRASTARPLNHSIQGGHNHPTHRVEPGVPKWGLSFSVSTQSGLESSFRWEPSLLVIRPPFCPPGEHRGWSSGGTPRSHPGQQHRRHRPPRACRPQVRCSAPATQ